MPEPIHVIVSQTVIRPMEDGTIAVFGIDPDDRYRIMMKFDRNGAITFANGILKLARKLPLKVVEEKKSDKQG